MIDDISRLLAEIDSAVRDYRSIFPHPAPLSANLQLAKEAADVIRANYTEREIIE